MAREYPRFLFSNPSNTKNKGPFVVHTLHPRFIVRVEKVPNHGKGISTHNGKYELFFLDDEVTFNSDLESATDALFRWLDAQIRAGEFTI